MQKTFLYMATLLISSHSYALQGQYGMSAGDTLVELKITGTLSDNRACTINNDNKINIEWKDLITMEMTGENYKQSIITNFQCNAAAKMTLKISGDKASFGNGLLASNSDNVAIQFYSDDKKVNVNEGFSYTWSSSASPPRIVVAPVAKNQQLNQQDSFIANASIVITFQ